LKQLSQPPACGWNTPAVYDWMNAGKLDFVVASARRRITQSALDAFLQTGTRAAKQEIIEKMKRPD
jgi:hypothetical protein